MKGFKEKSFLQKIIITASIVILLFNFIMPTYSQAKSDWGGQLWEPVQNLVCGLGDTVFVFLQRTFIEGAPDAIFTCTKAEFFIEKRNFATSYLNWAVNLPFIFGSASALGAATGLEMRDDEVTDYADADGDGNISTEEAENFVGEDIVFPSIFYSVDNIFANKIPAFDVNFINPSVEPPTVIDNSKEIREAILGSKATDNSDRHAVGNIASQLQGTIAKWYNALRNLALVVMLSILVYLGIRITLASTSAKEQAKYKVMLKDWVVAICILFVMHYIMAFALNVTEALTNVLYETYKEAISGQQLSNDIGSITAETMATSVRLAVSASNDMGQAMGYTVMYAVFVIYTIMFTWQYLKRVVYMAFLTMIAPLVAVTYPIDKIKDGKSQAFDKWLKEYIFNLLLQPLHLLLFTILVVSATDFMKTNIIYSLVSLGFLLQAVKIVKKLFGFDRPSLGGGGLAGGFAGGAIFSTALNMLQGVPQISAHGSGASGGSGGSNNNKINFADGSNRGSQYKNLSAAFGGGVPEGGTTTIVGQGMDPEAIRQALRKYNNAGYSKNAYGQYFNPYTDEYDSNYDPTKDPTYNLSIRNNSNGSGQTSVAGPNISINNNSGQSDKKGNAKNKKKLSERAPVRVIRGVASVGGRYLPAAGKTITKLAVSGLAAGTLGTIGIAAGLASDNIEDVAKYGALGLTGGYALGNKAFNSSINTAKNVKNTAVDIKDNFQQGYHGENYDAVKADKEWAKSKDVEKHLKLKFKDQWKDAKEKGKKLRKLGITDQKDIDGAIKLMNSHQDLSLEGAVSLVKFKNDFSVARSELRDEKKRKYIEKKVEGFHVGEGQKQKIMQLLDEFMDV